MTTLDLFSNGEFELSIIMHEADGFRVSAPGLARALGFAGAREMVRNVPEDEKGSVLEPTLGGTQQVWYITEAGFYRVLGQRQVGRIKDERVRAQVERFQAWVYGVVLPGLRQRTLIPAPRPELPSDYLAALKALVVTEEEKQLALVGKAAAEQQAAELAPRAALADRVITAAGDRSVRETAQVLARDHGIDIGQNRLFAFLREIRWIDSRGIPYQVQIDNGRLTVKTQVYDHPHTGEPTMGKPQVRITGKGLAEIHRRLSGGQTSLELQGGDV